MPTVLAILFVVLVVVASLMLAAAQHPSQTYTGGGMKIHVQEPWFTEVAAGRKTIEGKVGHRAKFSHLVGQTIEFHNGPRSVRAVVDQVRHHPTLAEYIAAEGWRNVAPHTGSDAAAVEAYLAVHRSDGVQVFGPDRVEEMGGMNAIVFRLI